ncbi:hypothetical protein NDU88_003377 [Pleurodeles waltl]|uniref:Uncharacterized protein n=1 Tax=Pleurodeles waltl TaxID=8319 RepID=A0AAV7VE08_PLEWA|nr:hypothetical protein NDU88_003377 [Pleurodeles waltl]
MGIRDSLLCEVEEAEWELRALEQRCLGHPELQREVYKAKERVANHTERLRCLNFKRYMMRAHDKRDNSGSLLAWLANQTKRGLHIVEIYTDTEKRIVRQEVINLHFSDYYTNLYTSVARGTETDIETFHSIAYTRHHP